MDKSKQEIQKFKNKIANLKTKLTSKKKNYVKGIKKNGKR